VNIAYGCCAGSMEKLDQYVMPRLEEVDVESTFIVTNQTSIAVAYNTILDYYTDRDFDVLILLHDDLEITDPEAEEKFLAALEPDVFLAGVAGGGGTNGLAWWTVDPVGHQRTDAMNIDFGRRTGDVDLLEGSILAFSPEAVRALRFDTAYPGFHGYDEIAAQAHNLGKRVVVADVDTHHHNSMGFKSAASAEEWLAADRLYRKKWGV
jgi:glycosyltransferase involved in cell wall biosynthesis